MDRRPVVFDCDGVLVDSEDLSWRAWRHIASQHDVDVTEADVERLTGRTAREVLAGLTGDRSDIESAAFLASVEETTAALFGEHLEAFEDAEDTVDHLVRIGYPVAVASSSTATRLAHSLRVTEMDQYFDVVVAGDEVPVSKPAPDIYLEAAKRLGVDPVECTAVEDSPSGVTAAVAAGMRVVAVDRGVFDSEDLRHADIVVPRLTPAVFFS